ncbi:MAG: hypothetical protein QOI07_3227 [Verrucomicrobiota bacterium]|jgi:tetratricopeptide (TPR) repeat protein
MNTYTASPAAFRQVARALREIDQYNESKEIAHLERAEAALTAARAEDDEYLDAIFYSGMVTDLLGRPADAGPYFQRILDVSGRDDLKIEAKFNLAVANYHRYSHRYLEVAEQLFLQVIEESADAGLRNLARANLAQTYAMWSRPSFPQLQAHNRGGAEMHAVHEHIRIMFEKSIHHVDEVRRELESSIASSLSPEMRAKIAATADNAAGMANMYLFDYPVPGKPGDEELLKQAVANLNSAEQKLPGDSANTCDMASAHLRWGVLQMRNGGNAQKEFTLAEQYLIQVLTKLRPAYGFAFYELGRLYRIWNRWDFAIAQFDRAAAIPDNYRDIDAKAVQAEKERAASHDSSYP